MGQVSIMAAQNNKLDIRKIYWILRNGLRYTGHWMMNTRQERCTKIQVGQEG